MKETGLAMTRSALNTLEQMAIPMQVKFVVETFDEPIKYPSRFFKEFLGIFKIHTL